MGKIVTIVWREGDGHTQGQYFMFKDEDAAVVEKALFEAEKREAAGAHFTVNNKEYWLRTDKYLYWTSHEENKPLYESKEPF